MFRKSGKDTIREMAISPYRLIYEVDDTSSTVMVRMLHHGARQEPEIK